MIDPNHCFSKLYQGGAIPLTMTQHCWHDLAAKWLDDQQHAIFFRQVQGVTPNETRDPDGTGRIVKFGPDRVEACERCGGCFS